MFVYIRTLGKCDATISTAIWYNTGSVIFSAVLWTVLPDQSSGESIIDMGLSPFQVLILIGVLASFQQFFLSQCHRYAEAAARAPLHYVAILSEFWWELCFFDKVMAAKFIFGLLLILAVNYYIFLRERTIKTIDPAK